MTRLWQTVQWVSVRGLRGFEASVKKWLRQRLTWSAVHSSHSFRTLAAESIVALAHTAVSVGLTWQFRDEMQASRRSIWWSRPTTLPGPAA